MAGNIWIHRGCHPMAWWPDMSRVLSRLLPWCPLSRGGCFFTCVRSLSLSLDAHSPEVVVFLIMCFHFHFHLMSTLQGWRFLFMSLTFQFLEYVRFTNLVFYSEYQPTSPRIHLVLNGAGELDEWNWENIPEHWIKRGMVGWRYLFCFWHTIGGARVSA